MNTRKLATYHTRNNTGYCEVHFDFKDGVGIIKYFDDDNNHFYTEEYSEKTVAYLHQVAENWILGSKILEGTNG